MTTMSTMIRALLISLTAVALAGCGGGGGGSSSAPPEPWSGTWLIAGPHNTDSRYDQCTGSLVGLEDQVVYDPANPPLCELDTVVVRQSGTAFTVDPQTVTCRDGSTASVSGQGTIDEATQYFIGALVWNGVVTHHYDGFRSGTTVDIAEWALEVSDGGCLIVPDLRFTATIQR